MLCCKQTSRLRAFVAKKRLLQRRKGNESQINFPIQIKNKSLQVYALL